MRYGVKRAQRVILLLVALRPHSAGELVKKITQTFEDIPEQSVQIAIRLLVDQGTVVLGKKLKLTTSEHRDFGDETK